MAITYPLAVRSVIFDFEEYRNDSYGLRQIDFLRNGEVIDNIPGVNCTVYCNYEETGEEKENAFNTTLSKTGPSLNNGWRTSHTGTLRLICVFNTLTEIDNIRIDNYHDSGERNAGVRVAHIKCSSSIVTSLVYGETIANSVTLYDGIIFNHIAVDSADSRIIPIADQKSETSFRTLYGGIAKIENVPHEDIKVRAYLRENGHLMGEGITNEEGEFAFIGPAIADEVFVVASSETQNNVNDQVFRTMPKRDWSLTWDIERKSYTGKTHNCSSQEGHPDALLFTPDGHRFYTCGYGSDRIFEYDMTTPWDVSTASYNSINLYTSGESAPRGLRFNPDGTKMYVTGATGGYVKEINLATAYHLAGATYSSNSSMYLRNDCSAPCDLFFSPDGLNCYIVGYSCSFTYQYKLTTPWDITTLYYHQKFPHSPYTGGQFGLFFSPDGLSMYVSGGGVHLFNLEIPWDISTCRFACSTYNFIDNSIFGIWIETVEGTDYLYCMGETLNSIHQYEISL
ncbi:MAG: hypothetical protein DRO88_02500 [Promethearchaeia archaeon]|nr:MAG: hypothetical protein DRO88_02500 [Candidatus Lokiarchaeia archaeon]